MYFRLRTIPGGFLSRYIIAGIDPGATTGIAMLSLSGGKIASHSTDKGMNEAVRIIEQNGTPSLIACDVCPAPEAAQKIASFFSCRLHTPAREIREEEKKAIARGSGVQNNHERDAYAAAVLAYRTHANKFRQIDALPELTGEEKGRLKHLMLKGYRLKDAFLELKEPEGKDAAPAVEAPKLAQHVLSSQELKERVSSLARENANLRMMLSRLEDEKRRLLQRVRLLENGVQERLLRDSELRSLRFQLLQALGRFKPKKKGAQQKKGQPGEQTHSPPQNDDLNRLGKPNIDLEKLVTEYRRGRKQS